MKIELDRRKYDNVHPRLKERLFAFVEEAECKELASGAYLWQYLDLGPRVEPAVLFFTGGIKDPVYSFAVIEALKRHNRVIAPAQPRCSSLAEYFAGIEAILAQEKVDCFHAAEIGRASCRERV